MLEMHLRKDKQFYIEKNLRNLHNQREIIQKDSSFHNASQNLNQNDIIR